MDQAKLLDTHVQLRRIYNLLGEVQDLSRQLAEALDRNDQVSAQMLLSMRGEPIRQAALARESIMQQLAALPEQEREWLRALLNGAVTEDPFEKGIVEQAAANDRLLKQVQELDKGLNMKITRGESVYES